MQSKVWIKPGLVIIYGASIDADAHRHHAIQLAWPLQGTQCILDGERINAPLIIGSNVEHQLNMEQGWILLVEPTSVLGGELEQHLSEQTFMALDIPLFSSPSMECGEDLSQLLAPLLNTMGIVQQFELVNQSQVQDKRIQTLLAELQQCLGGECIKPNQWRAAEVAERLALSESRFLHLFSEQLGVPWRPYLLWCRMLCAVRAIFSGMSATEAAYMAGFSDSAHLSRTFRKTFGMTIRQANAIFRPH